MRSISEIINLMAYRGWAFSVNPEDMLEGDHPLTSERAYIAIYYHVEMRNPSGASIAITSRDLIDAFNTGFDTMEQLSARASTSRHNPST